MVDRTVAKAMSHCVSKHARRFNRKIILLACHYDIIEWLNPDWIIDCNKQEYTDRRSMVGAFERGDRLRFDIREVSRKTWPFFSKYHYLSERLPGGTIFCFGLFHGENQIGFQCFANYEIGRLKNYHSNRTVIHPDYVGFGLGIKLINETSFEMVERGYKVKAKFTSTPVYKAMSKFKDLWVLNSIQKDLKSNHGVGFEKNRSAFRQKVKAYSFEFIGKKKRENISLSLS